MVIVDEHKHVLLLVYDFYNGIVYDLLIKFNDHEIPFPVIFYFRLHFRFGFHNIYLRRERRPKTIDTIT